MQITAEQKNTRQSARKVRLVANAVRKLPLEQALRQLAVIERKATLVVTKVVRQAIANAWHNHRLELKDLKLKSIVVNEGQTYKRWRAVSRGRGHSIFKRTSHIKVVLESKETKAVQPSAKTEEKSTKQIDKKSTKVAAKRATKRKTKA